MSAEAFRSEFDGVPGNPEKLRDSYDLRAQALHTYWPTLQTAQGQADRALDRAIAARADLTAIQGSLGTAPDWVTRAGQEAERLQREGERSDAEPPHEAEVRAATRDRQAANQARAAAQARVNTAQESLDAARELARLQLDPVVADGAPHHPVPARPARCSARTDRPSASGARHGPSRRRRSPDHRGGWPG